MLAKVGDRIVVESERMDVPPREGEVLEVIPHDVRPEFRVRWLDGHESEVRLPAGSFRILADTGRDRPTTGTWKR
jgi:hypothetical protein